MQLPVGIPLPHREALTEEERIARARAFADELALRRTVREFDPRPVAREVIEHCLRAAGSAPSGANQQPWRFVAVSDPAIKRRIRAGAEAEEREFYRHRATEEWLQALAVLGTDAEKPFLEIAPWLIPLHFRHAVKPTMWSTGESRALPSPGWLSAAYSFCSCCSRSSWAFRRGLRS